jgi:very-short-patch-repair endonuclease
MENLRRSREVAGGVDAAIAELARLQHGVVAWWQMRESGLGKASTEHRIQTGRIHALPHFNDWIVLGDKRFRVDCHWPDTRQIVELDGWDGHRTRTAFREDRARDRRLRAAGYSVTRLTWNQLEDEPEEIATDLHEILTA